MVAMSYITRTWMLSRCKRLVKVAMVMTGLLLLIEVLFLHNSTIQILPRVFLPNSYTYIDRSSVIYHNDNKILLLNKKGSSKILSKQNKTALKEKKNKTKTDQYVIYKFPKRVPELTVKDYVPKSNLFQHKDDLTSFYNGNISIHNPNPMAYHTVFGTPIYIISAHGRNGAQPENMTFYNGSFKDLYTKSLFPNVSAVRPVTFISITAWMNESLLQEDLNCCLLLKNQSVMSARNRRRMLWYQVKKQPLLATKSYCSVPRKLQSDKIIGASISLPPYDCDLRVFMKVQYPEIRKRGSLAFCSKIAYGPLGAERLIEWLELQRFVGVDRVMIYFYNLNIDAMRVLRKYKRDGFVDLQPFDYPQPDDPKRQVGEKAAQPFIDEQVAVYDCIERLKGFNYIGIIDFDEVVYSGITYKHNLKAFLKFLDRRYPDASGFRFMTEIFISDWVSGSKTSNSQTRSTSDLWHSQFLHRTAPMVDRVKSIINTERVVLDSIWTHNYTSLPGYKRYTISSRLGCLKHFRSCREKWVEEGKCFKVRKYKDYTIVNLTKNIEDTVLQKKKTILGL